MICLAVAVINHRQPEGTASTHGKESGWHSKAPIGLFMYGHLCTYSLQMYIQYTRMCVCVSVSMCVCVEEKNGVGDAKA